SMPDDAVTMVKGINDDDYDSSRHCLISAASCTTTCLSYMIKPLMNHFGVENFMSASMITVHAATGSQQVLDRLPATNATDLRKNRSILNNIILTTTGAAKALGLVIPEMKDVGFITESIRVPTSTGSLVILILNLRDDKNNPSDRDVINSIYKKFAESSPYLVCSEKQNVSTDIIGSPFAATVIESTETQVRTASVNGTDTPVTQAVIYGWYDNELGSYTNMLGEHIVSVAETM
ncbi:MAG: glyceraldehyde-3-phosphate dehydrogenase, partial [Desulfobulbaceae bacterium]|nr:glyceraldehyde-3-phosphate dehydrogenase [Desulfobulbaceae bacterium]